MMARARRAHLSQLDIRCRLFDVLVEPVLSYASHVWGPNEFCKPLAAGGQRRPLVATAADKVHMYFLRMLTGVGAKACADVLLRDMHRAPVMHHWVVLAARWWSKLAQMDPEVSRVARAAWLSDIDLMRTRGRNGRPHTRCWTYKLLHTLQALGVITPAQWGPSADLTALVFDESAVKQRLAAWLCARWAGVPQGDPRVAADGYAMAVHANWVYRVPPGTDCTDRRQAPPHMLLCLPARFLRVLVQLRCGWARLAVQTGAWQRPRLPREERVCQVCCGPDSTAAQRQAALARCRHEQGLPPAQHTVVEDLRHVILECPAYDDIRSRYTLLPASPWMTPDPCAALRALFEHDNQAALARMLHAILAHRADRLGITWW